MLDFAFERQNSKTQKIYQIATNKTPLYFYEAGTKNAPGFTPSG